MDKNTKQRFISTSIWSDGWFETLSPHEGYIYFNLLTNDHTNIAGIYPFSLKYVCADTGISRAEVDEAIEKFQAAGKAFFYEGYIIIPKWPKHQKFDKRQGGSFLGMKKTIDALPKKIKDFISVREHYDFDVSDILGEPSEPEQVGETAAPEEAVGQEEAAEQGETEGQEGLAAKNREGVPPPKTGGPTPNGQTAPAPPNQAGETHPPKTGVGPGSDPPKQGVPPPNSAHDLDLDLDLDSKKEKEKESVFLPDKKPPGNDPPEKPEICAEKNTHPPPDKPIESREDATTIWNKAREFWNEKGLKPVCRDLMMRPADTPEILRTFQNYSWAEIKNAIGNYAWHKFKAGSEYRPPPPYGSLAGFLKTGVEKYHDDDALDQQFRETK
jgi:hypothetical protein